MRINELARKLEVKAKAILDFLPTIGITDKRSHSSSVSDEIAEKLRQHFAAGAAAAAEGEAAGKEETATGQAPVSAPEPPAALPSEPAAPDTVEVRGESPVSSPPPESRPAPTAAGAIPGRVAGPSARGEPRPTAGAQTVSGGGGAHRLAPADSPDGTPATPTHGSANSGYCHSPSTIDGGASRGRGSASRPEFASRCSGRSRASGSNACPTRPAVGGAGSDGHAASRRAGPGESPRWFAAPTRGVTPGASCAAPGAGSRAADLSAASRSSEAGWAAARGCERVGCWWGGASRRAASDRAGAPGASGSL